MKTLLIAIAIVAVLYAVGVMVLLVAGKRTAARELARLLPNLVLLFKDLLKDPRVPRRSKLLLVFGAAWIASPIDLIPEFLPFLGPLDDAVVAALILRHLVRTAGPCVVAEHWRGEPSTIARLTHTPARAHDAETQGHHLPPRDAGPRGTPSPARSRNARC
jgi:uncharacterized membrane protein YkvA (DUF1232 family)